MEEIQVEKEGNSSMYQIQMIGNAIYVVILILQEEIDAIGVKRLNRNVSQIMVSRQ